MATLIPSFSACAQRMTPGERRLAERLEHKLEDDCLIWYDIPIGPKRLYPDFIILHPLRGLLILEVKDWKLDTIKRISPESFTILTTQGTKEVKNPLQQARGYALAVKQLLEHERTLLTERGHYKGKLCFPHAYGVVLTNITRKQFESQQGLQSSLQPHLVICQDEFYATVDPLDFQQRLSDINPYTFGDRLTTAQIDQIRWHLFPDIRLTEPLALPSKKPKKKVANSSIKPIDTNLTPNIIRIMDVHQEQLARSLGDGHRVIHGVAGSGKTLILVYRCLHLVEQSIEPILVLCFNVALSANLHQTLQAKGVGDRVMVMNFHRWCSDLIETYRLPKLRGDQADEHDEMVQRVIVATEAGKIPLGRYGAVLIDEGHDFKPSWLKLVAQMVSPQTNCLMLLYDDAQNIYEKRQRVRFTFNSVGIQARGRTTILKLNYRNTQEILHVAYAFAQTLLTPTGDSQEDEPMLVQPESAGRHGLQPELIKLANFRQEIEYLSRRAKQLHEQGCLWQDMAILYRDRWMAEQICDRFQQFGLPVEWVNRDKDSRHYSPAAASIKLVTMHSSKGLEFPVVFIPGIGYLPNQHSTPEVEARLLYVAMTRAVDQLVMTCDRPSEFGQRLEVALGSHKL